MSLFDWLEEIKEIEGDVEQYAKKYYKGSFGLTAGTALNCNYGADIQHTFGNTTALTCDPLSMGLRWFDKFTPVAAAGVLGAQGNVSLNCGPAFSASYYGPGLNVRRHKCPNKTSDHWRPHVRNDNDEETDDLDTATGVAVYELMTLILLTAAAAEATLFFGYPNSGSKDSADDKTAKGKDNGKTPEGFAITRKTLETLDVTINSRLIALLKVLEQKGGFADFGAHFLREAHFWSSLSAVLTFLPFLGSALAKRMKWTEVNLGEALNYARKALGQHAD